MSKLLNSKLHEPLSPYGSSVYNALITVVQTFAMAALLWVITDKQVNGVSIYDQLVKALADVNFQSLPYYQLTKICISFLGIIAIWHAYVTNNQFHAYRQRHLDTLLPFALCLFESFAIFAIPSNNVSWFSIWLMATMLLGLLAIFHMRQQMFETKAIGLFRQHFEDDADPIYFAIVKYCNKAIRILRQSSLMMIVASAAALPISATDTIRRSHIDLILVSAVYLVSLYRLSKYDIDCYLLEIATPWRPHSRRDEIIVESDGEHLEINATVFVPSSLEMDGSKAVVFLPGWQAGRSPTLTALSAYLGEDAGMPSVLISSKGSKVNEKSWSAEAAAMAGYLLESKYTQLIFVGHSEGAAKTAALCAYIQTKHPEITIGGLVLIAPVGIYPQVGLTGLFIKDALFETTAMLRRDVFRDTTLPVKALQAGLDVFVNLASEIHISRFRVFTNVRKQVRRMSFALSSYQDIRCPIVLLLGASDGLSSVNRLFGSRVPSSLAERGAALAPVFPNCPLVDVLIVRRFGLHGFIHFRARQISRASLYMLRRYSRGLHGSVHALSEPNEALTI